MNLFNVNHFVLVSVILSCLVDKIYGCNGYKARITSVENCTPDNVLTIDQDISIELTPDCFIITKGCVNARSFTTSNVSYKLTKNKVKLLEGKLDMCKEMESANEELKNTIQMLALPTACPVNAGKVCSDDSKKVNIGKHKNMLAAAKGKTRVELRIKHDTGKSCLNVETEIYKA